MVLFIAFRGFKRVLLSTGRQSSRRFKFTLRMAYTEEVFLRIEDEKEKFRLSFSYRDNESGSCTDLHFYRSLSEIVKPLCSRISLKLNTRTGGKKNTSTIPVQFIRNGSPVGDTTTCKELFASSDSVDLILKLGDRKFSFVKNAPWIRNLALPKNIMAGYIVYPAKIEGLFINENESEFSWYKCKDNAENELVGSGIFYIPAISDIGCKLMLRCTPANNGLKGPTVETYSLCEVEAGPGHCPFEDRHSFTNTAMAGNSFRVVSYNILADLYASSTAGKEALFSYCAPYALAADYRKQLLLKELRGYNADIICLQEVDCRVFKRDLKRVLNANNMDGILAKKGGQVNEGVACFYNTSRFALISEFCRTLGDDSLNEDILQNIWNRVNTNVALYNRLKERTTVVQILAFAFLENPKHKLVVANTHLYFHPNADHIRLLQVGMCLHYVEDTLKKIQMQDPESTVSVVFCGDFNSTPECAVYQLFTTGEVSADHNEWKSENETVTGLSLKTPFNFKSACGTPEFTNYTIDFKGCLDYIFYQTDFLDVEQVILFPPEEEVSRYSAIPSIVFPSDHIALIADLRWK